MNVPVDPLAGIFSFRPVVIYIIYIYKVSRAYQEKTRWRCWRVVFNVFRWSFLLLWLSNSCYLNLWDSNFGDIHFSFCTRDLNLRVKSAHHVDLPFVLYNQGVEIVHDNLLCYAESTRFDANSKNIFTLKGYIGELLLDHWANARRLGTQGGILSNVPLKGGTGL